VATERVNDAYLPGVELGAGIQVRTVSELDLTGVDLVVLAVPCACLAAVLGEVGTLMHDRSSVLVASKGLVPPLGTTPSAYVSERVHARAVATLAGPAQAREMIEAGASAVVATRDPDLRRQLRDVLGAGGLRADASDDVTGTEFAACATNAAALASAAAAQGGATLAGAAAGRVFSEVHALAVASGGRSETFAGLAGAGDLVASAIAGGQTADSRATLPLLELAFERRGIDAPVTAGLSEVLEGAAPPDQWLESVRSARPLPHKSHAA
jgi:glycerol-3-phosphate dehydrogenase (NAD(P)+)